MFLINEINKSWYKTRPCLFVMMHVQLNSVTFNFTLNKYNSKLTSNNKFSVTQVLQKADQSVLDTSIYPHILLVMYTLHILPQQPALKLLRVNCSRHQHLYKRHNVEQDVLTSLLMHFRRISTKTTI